MRRFLLIAAFGLALVFGCTNQERAKNLGGSTTIKLPVGQKLVTATWKDTDLWYLTRPMRPEETAETYAFHESSNFGVFEGTVTLVEVKQ